MDDQNLQITSQPTTLRRMVEDRLRTAILRGRFQPGQRLVERELCELIGVSRTSIREALRQLEAEGIVDTVSQRGPVVAVIDLEEARQLYAVRALLEGYAGREFARNATDEEIKELSEAVDALKADIGKDDFGPNMLGAKSRFYAVLMRGSRNVFIEKLLTTLHNRIMLLRLTTMNQPGRVHESLAEIEEIRNAIAARDPERAERACIRHIESASIVAMRVLQKQEGRKQG
ncbi:GntR family transcriptional regulator [Chelativorans sp. AA-79]|uniref:GntR family transcriptional regulator n=1 Tax=Chelativorans sp. AA-79 TaxID=3028735 RepID=UPI0023F88490|nr:GntR family transcriptional regulator [Chelativorans sp. AA-79]WEX08053.1 GntR family transcriptional regulator [Chelativorans sp. AA-79]